MPPRSHHCILCRKCILARDHHCFFTGSCVGLSNQRYFVAYCFLLQCRCSILHLHHHDIHPSVILRHEFYSFPSFHPTADCFWNGCLVTKTLGFLFFIVLDYASVLAMVGAGGIMVWQLFPHRQRKKQPSNTGIKSTGLRGVFLKKHSFSIWPLLACLISSSHSRSSHKNLELIR